MKYGCRSKTHLAIMAVLAIVLLSGVALMATPADAGGPDGYSWTEYSGNPVFTGTARAYYPRVIRVGDTYHMWYTDLIGGLYRCGHSTSLDGSTWAAPTVVSVGAGQPSHVVVVNVGSEVSPYYRMWYGDVATWPFGNSCLRTAESADGLTWTNDQAIGEDPNAGLLRTDNTSDPAYQWRYGTYGPAAVLHNPSGYTSVNLGDPMGNKYVMYYDLYTRYWLTGVQEASGLAVSADGINWSRYGNGPVLNASGGSTIWDGQYVYIGSVIADSGGYHAWYSGGIAQSHEGIGYASSPDGLNWTKDPQHIMHISDPGAPAWRTSRTYTPCVLQEGDSYRMWYTGVGSGVYRVGLATALATPTIASITPDHGSQGQELSTAITGSGLTGATSLDFGSGITIDSYIVNSSTQITATITISGTAAIGARDVTVTTPGGTATEIGGFTVNLGSPNGWYEQYEAANARSGVINTFWLSQSFTPATSHNLNTVSFNLQKVGSPAYTVTVGLFLAGADNKPIGTALSTTTFHTSSVSTAADWHEYQMSPCQVTAGTRYALVLSATEGAAGNCVYWRVNTSGTYARGMRATSNDQGATWTTQSALDFMFREGQNPPVWYEQYAASNARSGIINTFWLSQSFTPVTSHTLNTVSLCVHRLGSPDYTVTIALYSAGADNKPAGIPLCTTTFESNTLTTTPAWCTYQFSTGHDVTAGTRYALVLSATEGDLSNMVYWRVNTAGTYARGMRSISSDQGTTWTTQSALDFMFREGETAQ